MSPRSGAGSALSANAHQNSTTANANQNTDTANANQHTTTAHNYRKRTPSCLSISVSGLFADLREEAEDAPRAKRARAAVSPASDALAAAESDDPVRQLFALAFPSLPQLATAVSASSPVDPIPALRPVSPAPEGEGEGYGWFVFTDADAGGTPDQGAPETTRAFLPSITPDLPSEVLACNREVAVPSGEAIALVGTSDQDLAVQQALAADTVDDVLGDLF